MQLALITSLIDRDRGEQTLRQIAPFTRTFPGFIRYGRARIRPTLLMGTETNKAAVTPTYRAGAAGDHYVNHRCTDPTILSPHLSTDFDQRSATATAVLRYIDPMSIASAMHTAPFNKLYGKPRYMPPPLRTVRPTSSPYTPYACGAQCALLPVAVGAMHTHNVGPTRQTNDRQTDVKQHHCLMLPPGGGA